MKKSLLGIVVSFCIILLAISTHAARSEKIVWMGCGIVKKAFMGKMSEAYTEKTGIKFRMAGGGATKGIRLTSDGTADVGGTCRHLITDRNNKPVEEEANAKLVHVAWDGLVVIVNKNNKVDNITLQQVKDIFTGKINNWSKVGGTNEEINLLVRKGKISGVGYMTRLLLLKDKNAEYPGSASKFKSSGPLEKNVEMRSTAVGITGISSAKKRDVKFLSIDGIYPSKNNIASGKYPFFRPLYLVVSKNAGKRAKDFIDFVLSDEGQKVVSEAGTVNLKEGEKLQEQWALTKLP